MSKDLEFLIDLCKEELQDKGGFPPILAIEGRSEGLIIPLIGFDNGDSSFRREMLHRVGGLVGFGVDAQKVTLLMDSWFLAIDKEEGEEVDRDNLPRPSESPDRQSAISITSATKGEKGLKDEGSILYETNEDGQVSFQALSLEDSDIRSEGILEGFFEGVALTEKMAQIVKTVPGFDYMASARKVARNLAIKSGFLQPMGGKP